MFGSWEICMSSVIGGLVVEGWMSRESEVPRAKVRTYRGLEGPKAEGRGFQGWRSEG